MAVSVQSQGRALLVLCVLSLTHFKRLHIDEFTHQYRHLNICTQAKHADSQNLYLREYTHTSTHTCIHTLSFCLFVTLILSPLLVLLSGRACWQMTLFNTVLSGPCFASTARGYNGAGRGESEQKRDCTSELQWSHNRCCIKKYQLQKMKVRASLYTGF